MITLFDYLVLYFDLWCLFGFGVVGRCLIAFVCVVLVLLIAAVSVCGCGSGLDVLFAVLILFLFLVFDCVCGLRWFVGLYRRCFPECLLETLLRLVLGYSGHIDAVGCGGLVVIWCSVCCACVLVVYGFAGGVHVCGCLVCWFGFWLLTLASFNVW